MGTTMYYILFIIFLFSQLELHATKKTVAGYYAFVSEAQKDEQPVKILKKGIKVLKKEDSLNTMRTYSGYHTIFDNYGNEQTMILRAPLLFHALLIFNRPNERKKKLDMINYLCNQKHASLTQKCILHYNVKGSLTTPLLFAIEREIDTHIIETLLDMLPLKKRLHTFLLALSLKKYAVAKTIYAIDIQYQQFYRTHVTHFLLNYADVDLIEKAHDILIQTRMAYNPLLLDTNGYDLLTRILLYSPHKKELNIIIKQEELFEHLKESFNLLEIKTIKTNKCFAEKNLLDIASHSCCSLPIITELWSSGLSLTPERLSHSEPFD